MVRSAISVPSRRFLVRQPTHLEDALRLAHGALDVQRLDVLPVLLQKRHEEVDSKRHIRLHLIRRHLDVSDGDGHAKHLLELELDSRLHLKDLVVHRLARAQQRRELARLVEPRSQNPRNRLDDRVRREEGIVLLRELLDRLLLLVELAQVVRAVRVDPELLGLRDVHGVAENGDAHVRGAGRSAA